MARVTSMPEYPQIEAEVTFLSEFERGRMTLPSDLSTRAYRPHIVVGDPNQREAVIRGNEIQEEYLGVVFLAGPERLEFSKPTRVQLGLLYYPNVRYDSLVPGATFTIREGARIVGFGRVNRFL
jgi:hypothetical protein